MAYFLGSEVEVCLTTETSKSVAVADVSGKFLVSGTGVATVAYGINSKDDDNAQFPADALSDITGIDLGIGSMDEDVDYLGHRTPLKAEVHKQTTTTYALMIPKKKPKTLSIVPIPEYETALLKALLIKSIIKIIIMKIPIPKITSKTYSLSIMSSTYGLTFGKT